MINMITSIHDAIGWIIRLIGNKQEPYIMKMDKSVLVRTLDEAWNERTSDVELVYPYQQNREKALLRIWACKLGNYLTAGRRPYATVLDENDSWVREAMSVVLRNYSPTTQLHWL
jgi:hypothetical protein